MSVFRQYSVECTCGAIIVAQLADSVNVVRSPELREAILARELHRVTCPGCEQDITVEKTFYYTDLSRSAFFKVMPRGERHTWKAASKQLDAAVAKASPILNGSLTPKLRVAFGMDELREKLVAEDAGLDDRVLELVKVLLLYEHPVLLRRPRLRLILEEVDRAKLRFSATHEHDRKAFRIDLPRAVAVGLEKDRAKTRTWARTHKESLFELRDHWVNVWRWSSQPLALQRLREFAQAVADGGTIDPLDPAFRQMVAGLPKGAHLPPWAKQDLRTLQLYCRAHDMAEAESELYEVRFDMDLESDWADNEDRDDLDTLWQLMENLPATDVEGKTKIREIYLTDGGESGEYQKDAGLIFIGSKLLADRERFEDMVRHEVAHAVYEAHVSLIDSWLKERFGWQTYETEKDELIDAWVGEMGGWGDLTKSERDDVRGALRQALSAQKTLTAGPKPSFPADHPWNSKDFGPRCALEQTGSNWFENCGKWFRFGDKAFFLNYWYRSLAAVNVETLALVAQMPRSYAAMSHQEFFAELYALYYDRDDPLRSVIPSGVMDWFETTLNQERANAGSVPEELVAKRTWGNVTRSSAE